MAKNWNWIPENIIRLIARPGTQLVLASVCFLILNLFGNEHFILRNDDAYYYFTVARNWAVSGQWSFDGITPTSGVQPLWAGVLSLVAWLYSQLGGDLYSMSLVRLFLCVASLFHVISGALFYLLLRRWFPSQKTLALITLALWLFTPGWAFNQTMGLESPIYATVYLLTLHQVHGLESGYRQYLMLGISLGVMVLARVDAVFFSAALTVLVAIRTIRQQEAHRSVRLLTLLVTSTVIVVGSYLFLNYRAYGDPLPVSGQVKLYDTLNTRDALGGWFSSQAINNIGFAVLESLGLLLFNAGFSLLVFSIHQYVFHYHGVSWLAEITVVTAAVVSVGIIWQIAIRWRKGRRITPGRLSLASSRNQICATVFAAGLVHFGFVALYFTDYMKYSAVGWYFVPQCILLLLITAWVWQWFIAHWSPRFIRNVIIGVVAINLAVTITLLMVPPPHRVLHEAIRELALWGNHNLPANARIGSFNAGVAGYSSTRPVFNLDGLAANHEYFNNYYKRNRICAYLEYHEIDYIFDYLPGYANCLWLAVAVGADPAQANVVQSVFYGRPPTGGHVCLVQYEACLSQ